LQIGGRKRKLVIDTAILLTDFIKTSKKKGKKTSTLFINVKGAFDYVAKNRLLAIIARLRLPT
jgi:hypothetical protein